MIIKKKFRLLLALIALFICLSSIEKTYAKYITSASGNTDITISRWNIKLNDFDIDLSNVDDKDSILLVQDSKENP